MSVLYLTGEHGNLSHIRAIDDLGKSALVAERVASLVTMASVMVTAGCITTLGLQLSELFVQPVTAVAVTVAHGDKSAMSSSLTEPQLESGSTSQYSASKLLSDCGEWHCLSPVEDCEFTTQTEADCRSAASCRVSFTVVLSCCLAVAADAAGNGCYNVQQYIQHHMTCWCAVKTLLTHPNITWHIAADTRTLQVHFTIIFVLNNYSRHIARVSE